MASENQQQEFELLTDDDDWSDSPKAGKKNSLWNTNAVVVKSNDLLTAKTNLTLNELRIILVAISKIDSMNPEVRGDASYWVSAKELREIGSERSKAYKYLQNAVNTLYNRSVIRTFGSNGKERDEFRWISKVSYRSGMIGLTFSQEVLPFLTRIRSNFIRYPIKQISELKSVSTLRFFELCVRWRGQVKKMTITELKDEPNIIWFIGGDIRGDVKTAEWEALATSIKAIDKNHLMTFHPRGRTTSATWFNNAPWLDFNMFQSGHRRYGQRFGNGDYPIEENTEEDNWRFVERSMAMKPMKPVIDGEPIYEEIPHGLHDENELLWKDYDVRRYAYWSVFAGSFGHTYGHNSIMQFIKPGVGGAYGAKKPWYDALNDPGYNQMKYLKNLMLTFPFFERVPDQSVITGQNGERYDRAIATRGNDYLMVYNYTGRPMEVDFSKISGAKKNAWWYTTKDGKLEYIGEFDNGVHKFQHDSGYSSGNDHVLIVVDSSKDYVKKDCYQIDTHE